MTEIVTTQTPPLLHGPSEKEKRYDRQLRLWAASGQAALESAHLVLVNSGSGTVGIETLKNLVLPGIGKFTILDDALVEEADLGVNFFLDQESLGKPRGERCTELLLELNPEVEGRALRPSQHEGGIKSFLDSAGPITLIMYSNPISREDLQTLENYNKQYLTPLVAVSSAGFYSYFKTSLPGTFPIVDTHPDETATTDLRLLKPWSELETFCREMTRNIDDLDAHEHGHIPYLVLLLYYLERWRQDHEGKNPVSFAEKKAFGKYIADAARRDNPEGGEENYDEAVTAVLRNTAAPSLPSTLREVFEHKHQSEVEKTSSFWVIADAIKVFYDKHQCLPLPGRVPDMKAQSKVYVQLQNIYKAKARQDASEVLEIAQQLSGGNDVDPEEVELFCKNAAFVKLINAQVAGPEHLNKAAAQELENDMMAEATEMPLSLMPIYLALSATAHDPAASAEEIVATVKKIVPEMADNTRLVEAAQEVARARGSELHNVSALTGGMVAQELIKIITKQYIPIDNTCVFDGIGSRTQVLRL